MSELTPITRVESYLDAIVNNGIPPTEDVTRIETFLQAIYDNTVCQLTPITRIEMFLGKISGQDIELPKPITRIELYLAAIAGEDVELPENPITRLEMYLAEWADSGDWTTISGAIVEFIAQRAHKLKSCVVTLEPIQDLSHGDPSPTNICPISGWTGVSVFARGHNMWDEDWESGDLEGVNGTPVPSSSYIRSKNFCSCLPNTTYFCKKASTNTYIFWYDENETHISHRIIANDMAINSPSSARYFKLSIAGTTYNNDISINYPSTDTEYHAYNGNSYSVTWESEVFGGNYDFVNGKGKDGMGEVNFDDLSWSLVSSTYGRWAATVSNIKAPADGATLLNAVAEQYKIVTSNAYNNIAGTMYCVPNGTTINVCNGSTTDKPKGKLAYEIVNPADFSATPTPITALKGYNAMWSDGDSIEVTVHGTPVEVSAQQALNMLLGGAYHNNQTADDVSDEEALDIILGGEQR